MTTEKKPEVKNLGRAGRFSKVGNQLKKLRLLLKFEQYELAMLLKIRLKDLIDLEDGKDRFKLNTDNVMPLFEKYGVDTTWLFTGAGNIFQHKTSDVPLPTYLAAMFWSLNDDSSEFSKEFLRLIELPSQMDRIEANQQEILKRLGAFNPLSRLKEAV